MQATRSSIGNQGEKERTESKMTVSILGGMTASRAVSLTERESTIGRTGLACGEKNELNFGWTEFEAVVQNMSENIQKTVG